MHILCISTSAIITPNRGNEEGFAYGGMERELSWLVKGLRELGQEVTVLCKTGSTIEGPAFYGDSEPEFVEAIRPTMGDYDVIIDLSHDKLVSRTWPGQPQINTYQVMAIQWDHNPVFISKAQRTFLKREDAPVIYYGQDQSEYPLTTGPRDNYFLYLGSLIQEKRVHWVASLSERTNIPAIIAGPKWQPEYWPTLDEIAEWPMVTVRDEVGGQEKLELLQKAKALVHPIGDKNWVEAGAIVVLEALAVGTPVIATSNGCIPEYIHENINGFICQSVDEMEMATTRVNLLSPQRCRLSVAHFTYQRMAKEYLALAQEVVDGRAW